MKIRIEPKFPCLTLPGRCPFLEYRPKEKIYACWLILFEWPENKEDRLECHSRAGWEDCVSSVVVDPNRKVELSPQAPGGVQIVEERE